MTDYTKLVKALRYCTNEDNVCTQEQNCGYYGKGFFCQDSLMNDAADVIEALLKENKELIEDHPEMVEADGHWEWRKPNGEVLMPKRGEWVEDTTTYAGPSLSNYKCSLCGKICGTWRSGLKHDELPNWCGNCGADMRKTEVQYGGTKTVSVLWKNRRWFVR